MNTPISHPPVVDGPAVLETPAAAAEAEIHPVLADILKDNEPDTVSWVKG